MKSLKYIKCIVASILLSAFTIGCDDLDEPLQNQLPEEQIDYTNSDDMVLLLYGAYGEFNHWQWESYPLLSVRGDDVNSGGYGDQQPFEATDRYTYDRNYWMYNSVWLNLYNDIFLFNGLINSVELYKANGANEAISDQYIAEIKVMKAFELLQLARTWGNILVPETSVPEELSETPLSTFDEAMQQISNMMDEAIPALPSVRPNQRTDVEGGITRYTALAVKAMANLEMKNFQEAADATGQIINSGAFSLYSDFYSLFKMPGELSNESLLEFQYSDFGQSTGTTVEYTTSYFGPPSSSWSPAVTGIGGGWGFYEPSLKYVKFMIDRNDQKRLTTSVIFTPAGISELQSDPNYSTLPAYISTTTPDGDEFGDADRYNYLSGKHYLPSNQTTQDRPYASGKNLIAIRYSEVLLIHAEALVNGANSTVMNAVDAINEVRGRAGLSSLGSVTLDDVLDEKYAEFGMEWGIRFADMLRYNRENELSYDGRTFSEEDRYLPYPLAQLDLLPQLSGE